MTFCENYGPWAIITGASSGIGSEFARQIAARGINVALVARRTQRLERLAGEIETEFSVSTRSISVDLTEPASIDEIAKATDNDEIGLLINNAGLGANQDFFAQSARDQDRMLALNCRAPLMLTHHFGKRMQGRGRGGIVFVSSITGLIPTPRLTHYSATKAWNHFMGLGLYTELKRDGVDVLSLCPGTTDTEFFSHANLDPRQWSALAQRQIMAPADVVSTALARLGRQASVVPGLSNRLLTMFSHVLPENLTPRLANRVMRFMRTARVDET